LFSAIVRPNWRNFSSIARSDGSCRTSGLPTARDRVFGEIVDRRAEAAGRHGAVGALEHAAEHRREALRVVADGVLREHVQAVVGQDARDVDAIGVDQLAEENLGPDRHDLDGRHPAAFDARRPEPLGPYGLFGSLRA
jgi:hypothetical protein